MAIIRYVDKQTHMYNYLKCVHEAYILRTNGSIEQGAQQLHLGL